MRSFLIGLIGAGIQASRTPAMHEQEARHQGIPYVYRLLDLDRLGVGADSLGQLLRDAERMGYDGLNVTHPCKQLVLPLLTSVSDNAKAIGAANTVVLRNGERIGHNTDSWGFKKSFVEGLPDVEKDCVLLLGAGGAGAAVAHALLESGVNHLQIHDTTPYRSTALAAALTSRFPNAQIAVVDNLAAAANDAEGIVHATPTGMASHPGLPLPEHLVKSRHWVAEIVYFPLETALLKLARARGCRTVDGGGMAVYQAVRAFELFTGVAPNAARMREHFLQMD